MSKNNIISNTCFHTLIRKVSLIKKDSVVFHGYSYTSSPENITTSQSKDSELSIDFKNNDISFQYSAPFFTQADKILYRYKLTNYHSEWSQWSYDTKKEYSNLAPRKYVFIVEAKNIYNQISEPVYFNFQINYPWYRTFYAYTGYLIFLILLVIGIVKYFTLRLKRKNEQLEEIVKERTSELVQKNVELEQQTEEIITQAEELHIVNQELTKFSTAVQETDNAIILADKEGNFIWINSAFTKIFGYTFDDLINEVSHNLISNKTDLYIKDKINKCLSEKISVEYELKLKNKSKNDIWVHTTLTPILDDNNEIETLIAIDSDITKIKNAEVQIRDQRDQIKASIKYAKTIQDSVLPAKKLITKLFDNFIIFKAKDIVSGDFYWISNIFKTKANGNLTRVIDNDISFKPGYTSFFVVVDCTGHGVPGAFMSLIGNHLLGEIINEERYSDPKNILEILDLKLGKVLKRSQKKNYDGMALSICRLDRLKVSNKEKTKVTFAGAKQHITYYKKELNKFEKLRGVARQIGFVINDSIEFKNHEFFLETGDFLFLYSDGLKDLNNKERDSFGHKRTIDVLKHNITKDVAEIEQKLTQSMEQWLSGENQRDDITFVGLKM
ncbi:MAG: SpoIIE family protein phosphatase [Bacteroidota bacterium]|nr:SpoIIE family protein phosphatase [Bacteroidota bacterium]